MIERGIAGGLKYTEYIACYLERLSFVLGKCVSQEIIMVVQPPSGGPITGGPITELHKISIIISVTNFKCYFSAA